MRPVRAYSLKDTTSGRAVLWLAGHAASRGAHRDVGEAAGNDGVRPLARPAAAQALELD